MVTRFCPTPNMQKCARVTPLVFWFFLQPTAKTPGPIFTINTSNDVVSRKYVPFRGPENKILHFDPIFPQNANFWTIFDGTKFQVKKH